MPAAWASYRGTPRWRPAPGAASGPSRTRYRPLGGWGCGEWAATRVKAAWRSLQGPNRYVLKVPTVAVQWLRRTAGQFGRRDTNDQKKPARERSSGCPESDAGGRPRAAGPVLKARRDALEARWRGEMAARWGV
jgi:hypothetical protein